MTPEEFASYCERIGLSGPLSAKPEAIMMLQEAHRRAIPFENLDIPLGRGISLAPEAIFAKLVTAGRGGYCFEQNALFLRVLTALGIVARPLLARVWLAPAPGEVPGLTHSLVLAEIGARAWVADVGFGGSIAPLLPLEDNAASDYEGVRHSLHCDAEHGWMLRRNGAAQYSFTEAAVWPADLVQANHFTATAAQSRFTGLVIVSRPEVSGVATLTDRRLSAPEGELTVPDAASYRALLEDRFGLRLSQAEILGLGLFPQGRTG